MGRRSNDAASRLLLVGDGLSAFGGWIDFLAILTLAAWQFQVSPWQMAAVSVAGLLPGMLAGPAIGRWCDRGPVRHLLMASIVGRFVATAAILFCTELALFVLLVGLRSLFATVAPPAINVLALRHVGAADRPRFFSLLNVLNNSAKVLAPAIGTVSSSLAGEGWALRLSLLFSAAAFLAFALMRAPAAPSAANDAGTAGTTDAERLSGDDGGAAAAATALAPTAPAAAPATAPATASPAAPPSLLPLLWLAATCAFLVFTVNHLVPLVLQRAGFDKALLGVLIGCAGAGNILSGLWLARRAKTKPLRGELQEMLWPGVQQALGFGAIGLVLGLRPPFADAMLSALFFAIGTASARYAIAMSMFVATHHASAAGSVWGQLQSWQNTMMLIAPLLGAAVLQRFGPAALFALATGAALLSFGVWAGCRRLRFSVDR